MRGGRTKRPGIGVLTRRPGGRHGCPARRATRQLRRCGTGSARQSAQAPVRPDIVARRVRPPRRGGAGSGVSLGRMHRPQALEAQFHHVVVSWLDVVRPPAFRQEASLESLPAQACCRLGTAATISFHFWNTRPRRRLSAHTTGQVHHRIDEPAVFRTTDAGLYFRRTGYRWFWNPAPENIILALFALPWRQQYNP